MALLLPVLLLVLFAIAEYGRFFYLRSMAATVASDAARLASLPGTTDDAITTLVRTTLTNTASDTPSGYGLQVTPVIIIQPAARAAGQPVTVSLSYPFTPMILPQFVGETLFPADIAAGATAMVEP